MWKAGTGEDIRSQIDIPFIGKVQPTQQFADAVRKANGGANYGWIESNTQASSKSTNMGTVHYSQVRSLSGMTSIGNGYFTDHNGGAFTNGALQAAAGNFGAWNANPYGAMQSSPFENDIEGTGMASAPTGVAPSR